MRWTRQPQSFHVNKEVLVVHMQNREYEHIKEANKLHVPFMSRETSRACRISI